MPVEEKPGGGLPAQAIKPQSLESIDAGWASLTVREQETRKTECRRALQQDRGPPPGHCRKSLASEGAREARIARSSTCVIASGKDERRGCGSCGRERDAWKDSGVTATSPAQRRAVAAAEHRGRGQMQCPSWSRSRRVAEQLRLMGRRSDARDATTSRSALTERKQWRGMMA